MILTEKKLLEPFKKKGMQKPNQKEFRIEKVIKKKVIIFICKIERL